MNSCVSSFQGALSERSRLHAALLHIVLWVLSFALAVECWAQNSNQDSLEEILIRARDAYGLENDHSPAFTKLVGSARIRDIDLTYNNTWDRRGRFILDLSGPVRMVQAFDGQKSWSINPSRSLEFLELGARERSLLTNWMVTGYWLSKDAPVVISLDVSSTTDSSAIPLSIKFKNGKFDCTAIVARATGLLKSFSISSSGLAQTYQFTDYREYSGIYVAHNMRILENGREFGKMSLVEVSFPQTVDAKTFSPRAEDQRVARFDPGAAASLTVVAGNNKTYVPAIVNGRHQGWFLFDTGANGSVISSEFARLVGAERIGKVDSTGIGGRIEATAVRLNAFTVGPATINDVVVVARNDVGRKLAPPGRKLSGLLGNDLLMHCVIEYEHQRKIISLHDPKTYQLPRGSWQTLKMNNGSPVVEINYEGKQGWFLVDTGADAAVLMSPNTVHEQKLLRGRNTRPTNTFGSGGSVRSRNGQLKSVVFAGQRFNNVNTIFLTERKGTLADALIDGIVGVGLFGDSKIVLDYQNRRIALVK